MRKICALCLIAFYLVLASGEYECLLHCTADYLFSEKATVSLNKDSAADRKKGEAGADDEKCGDNCTCCYHHGSYVVKENVHTFFDFRLSATHLLLTPISTARFYFIPKIVNSSISWPRATGPPFISGTAIYLANQTFLI